jgi:hypothetical protein
LKQPSFEKAGGFGFRGSPEKNFDRNSLPLCMPHFFLFKTEISHQRAHKGFVNGRKEEIYIHREKNKQRYNKTLVNKVSERDET